MSAENLSDAITKLEVGQAGLQEQIHGLRRTQEDQHLENRRRVEKIEHQLNGNGQPGLIAMVTKMYGAINFAKWMIGISIPVIIALLGYLIAKGQHV